MHTLYYSDLCPECPPFIAELNAQGIAYEAINITASMKNLKNFLAVRDRQPAFHIMKEKGYAGIPCLYTESGQCIFDINGLALLAG